MWNPFKKIKNTSSNMALGPHTKSDEGESNPKNKNRIFGVGMGMMQKIAMKKLEKMSPQEREKMMREAMNPKNKNKMLSVMEHMKASGQITEEQYRMAREKLGL